VIRSISLPTHAALELGLGLALLAGPFVLGLSPAALKELGTDHPTGVLV